MLIVIENVLSKQDVAHFRTALSGAVWEDGGKTAGSRAQAVKQNLQINELSPVAIDLGNQVLRRIGRHPLVLSAALPERIYPPRFNLYQNGGHYGAHVDAPLMRVPDAGLTIRTDLSATIFLSEPEDYDGGELTIEGQYGAQQVKLPAGDMVLYPSTSLHSVSPVTRGQRIGCFFWMQSAVADERARTLLFDLDQSIQALSAGPAKDDPALDGLIHVYHNLVRRWAAP